MRRQQGVNLQDFFIYQLAFSGLAAANSATDSFTIQADSDFRWEKATYFADIAAAGQTDSSRVVPLVTVLVTDTGSGRQLMDGAVPIPVLFGTGQIPFILHHPKVFGARATVSVTLTNFDAAQTYNIRLAFIGTKIFRD